MIAYTKDTWKDVGVEFLKVGFFAGFLFTIYTNYGDFKSQNWLHFGEYWIYNGIAFGVFWVGNGLISTYPDRWVTWTQAPFKRLLLAILFTLLFTVLAWFPIVWMYTFQYYGFDVVSLFKRLTFDDIKMTLTITFAISTFLHGRAFLFEYRDAQIEAERLKKEQAEARYEVLKNQVNPHFLFNSLNVLTTLVHIDADKAEAFTRRLADVYRYILDSRDKEIVPLDTEIEVLEAYFFLMETRFGSGLHVEMDIPRGLPYSVAPLTLQMLVENALKHNTASKSKQLRLSLQFNSEKETIVIKNNLQAKGMVESSSGIGLENIKARYAFLTDKNVDIIETESEFSVIIPLLKTSKH